MDRFLYQPTTSKITDWIPEYFYLYDTTQPLTLIDAQARPLELFWTATDSDGLPQYKTLLWSWPKKSAKSSVLAAVCDYVADTQPRSSIKLIGNDLKQADSRIGFYLRESIRLGQKNGKRSKAIKITPSGYKIEYPNGSRVEMLPIDPTGEAGGNDDLIVYSELWGWKTEAQKRMWEEMTLSPNKPYSRRLIDTYAGFDGGSPLLEPLYETGVKQGRQVWPDLEVYANDAAKILAVWVTKPMFVWQTPAYYAEQVATLHPAAFDRMHRNKWVGDDNAFVPFEWWQACGQGVPPLEQYEPCLIGVDAAVSGDCFGIVMVSRRGDKVYVRYARKWTPPQGGKIDFSEPESELARLCSNYYVLAITYDEHELHDFMTRFRIKYGKATWEFEQGKKRLLADKMLFDMIREQRILHSNEPDLTEHVKNSNAAINKEDRTLRIVKRQETLKIDCNVAQSMCVYEIMALML